MGLGLAALGLLLLLPAAAAQTDQTGQPLCVIRYTPDADFGRIVVTVDLEFNESAMTDLLAQIDADGDRNITSGEVETYEASSLNVTARTQRLAEKKLYLDGYAGPSYESRVTLDGFEGPASARAARHAQEIRTYSFDSFEADWYHFMNGGLYSQPLSRVVVEFVVLEAPEGWVVWRVNETEFKQPTVQLSEFDTKTLFEVVFARQGRTPPATMDPSSGGGVPSTPVAWALAAVLAGLLAIRWARPARHP